MVLLVIVVVHWYTEVEIDVGVVTVSQGVSVVVEIVQPYVLSEVVPATTQGQDA